MREWIKVPRFACSLAIVLPVVCGLSGFSSGGLPDLNGVAMLECSGLPCIDVTIASGKHLKMLIDTGNVQSIVDEASAKTLGLEIKPYVGRDGKPRPDSVRWHGRPRIICRPYSYLGLLFESFLAVVKAPRMLNVYPSRNRRTRP